MTECQALQSHITDSRFFGNGYTTPEARQVFCDLRRLQRWLDVEAALALCQAELNIIPADAAEELAGKADIRLLDPDAIRDDIRQTGHSLLPLLDNWGKTVSPLARRYIHYGATTQDIQDSAQSLELKDICTVIERDLTIIRRWLLQHAVEQRDTLFIGRTHFRQALPTTLGLKMAVWLDEMDRHRQRLAEGKKRLLVSQLFGGVGTMAALGEKGLQLLAIFSKRLGLSEPRTAWHSSRDRLAEFVSLLSLITASLARIANEICQLSRDEIGEFEEPFHMGKIGSSTMPHKRNPESCEQVVVLSRLVKAQAGVLFDGLLQEHERDYRGVRTEWASVVDGSLYACGALAIMKKVLAGLIIHQERIKKNMAMAKGFIGSEALMFQIGEKIGKQEAHQLVYEASMKALESGVSLEEALLARPEIAGRFTAADLAAAVDPRKHAGIAGPIIDRLTAVADQQPATTSTPEKPRLVCPLAGRKQAGCSGPPACRSNSDQGTK